MPAQDRLKTAIDRLFFHETQSKEYETPGI
jgi:hypothetical protein